MSRRATGAGAAVLAVAFTFWGEPTTGAQEKGKAAPPPSVVRWEYKIFPGAPDEREFNKLGADGWELATSVHPAGGPPTHTFKRPVR
jgi:hypothetical protein